MIGDFGAGLDAKPDEAMFIYLHYKLPDWYYITLNNSTKSASFRYVINRLYIGQFQELSHLRDGTLTKAIPCSRAMPFVQKLTFCAKNFRPVNEVEYAYCKIIFTLRYFPTNNNWRPFISRFIHDFHKYVTIEYGIHIKNNKTCPKWIHPTSSYYFLSQQVQEDILSYSCNSACAKDKNICQNVKSWNIDNNQGMNSANGSVKLWYLSLAINDLKTPDTCNFKPNLHHSYKFCDGYWDAIEPQFITVPITTNDESLHLRTLNNWCHKLWNSITNLNYDFNLTELEMNSPTVKHWQLGQI